MTLPAGGLPLFGTLYPGGALPVVDGQNIAIPNVGTPVLGGDAANKTYVDAAVRAGSGTFVFQALSNLIAFNATGVANGTQAAVATPDREYELLTAPSSAIIAATDGVTIVQPTTPNTARWVIKGLAYSYVSAWWVDPAGNNTNDGQSSGTPITEQELEARLFPSGRPLILRQNVTVNVAAATYTRMRFNVSLCGDTSFTLTVICAITSGSPITISSFVRPVANVTRGELTTLSGTFVAGERIRLITGANAGAIAYSTGLHSGATNTYHGGFVAQSGGAPDLSSADPSNGDQCVVDNPLLVSISRLELTASGGAKIIFKDAKIIRVLINGSNLDSISSLAGGTVTLLGCAQQSISGIWQSNAGGATCVGCRTLITSKTSLMGSQWLLLNHCIQGILGVGGDCASYGITIDGGHLRIGTDGDFNHPGDTNVSQAYIGFATSGIGGIEVCNGPGINPTEPAIRIANGILHNDGFQTEMWGLSTPYAIGFQLMIGAWIYVNNSPFFADALTKFLSIPSTINLSFGFSLAALGTQITRPYGIYPILMPQTNSGVVCLPYFLEPGVVNVTLADLQSAANVLTLAPGPQYTAKAYLEILVAGAFGKLIVNEIHTGPSGTVQTTPVTAPIDITTVGNAGQGIVTLAVNGSSPVQYSVTGAPGTFTKGSLSYKLNISVTQEPT